MKRKSIPIALASLLMFALPLSACGGESHQYASEWSKDESDHWHACTLESHSDVADKAAHDFDNGKITKAATEEAEGVKTYTCRVCSYEKYEAIAKLPHTHTFDMTKWASDEENHWHPSTCGHEEEKDSLAAHTWDEGKITTPATEEAEGVKTYTCTVCEKTKEESIAKLPHTHTFDMTSWTKDETGHWRAATCEHTDQKKDFAAHSGDWSVKQAATYTSNRIDERDCAVCGYHEEKEIADSKLPAQDRELRVEEIANVTFDGLQHGIPDEKIIRTNDEGGLTVEYREKGTTNYTTYAPDAAGTYEYRVTLAGTTEWKEKVVTGELVIEPMKFALPETVFVNPGAPSGYVRLFFETLKDGTSIEEATNGWTTFASILAPLKYNAVGRHTVPVSELFMGNYCFALDAGDVENITIINYDFKNFIAGVTNYTYVTGRGPVAELKIEQGSVAVGDTVYICELDKEATVLGITIYNQAQEKVTVDDNAALLLGGISDGELKKGMVLSKPETISAHRSAVVDIELYDEEKVGKSYTYVNKDRPLFNFSATSISLSGRIALPSGVTSISSGEKVEGIVVDFTSVSANWEGRTFYVKEGNQVIGEGTVTATHDHSFGSDGSCECGVSDTTSGKFSNKVVSFEDYFYEGEQRSYTCTLTGAPTASVTYQFALLDSYGDTLSEGFEFKVYSTLNGNEVSLNSSNSYTVTRGKQLPIKVVVSNVSDLSYFLYCNLQITVSA